MRGDGRALGARAGHYSLARMSRPRPDYSGMTVNERLGAARLLPEWDAAITAGDRRKAIDVLGRVDIDEDQASSTVDAVLDHTCE